MQLCLYTCVSGVCLLSRLEASRPSCDPLSPLLISSTLSSRPPCLCCVSAPPLRPIASSRLDTPALCHTAADKSSQPRFRSNQISTYSVLFFTYNFSRDLMYIITNSRVYIICTLCWCKRVHCIFSPHARICRTVPCVREYVHSSKRIKTQTHKIISSACFHTWRQQIEQLSVAARISPLQWQLGGEKEEKRQNNYSGFAYNTFQSSSCFSSSGVQTSER